MFFLDAHVHFYDEYDADLLFDFFAAHAKTIAPGCADLAMAVMLRDFQSSLLAAVNPARLRKWRIEDGGEKGCAALAVCGDTRISLFPARQVAAKERIELLGFFGEAPVPDGLPLAETAARLRDAGFTPVIAWGKGKWLFGRGRLVRELMAAEAAKSPKPLVGDSALRPFFWAEPLYGVAKGLGLRLTYGSDPLPGAGNEKKAGGYATLVDAPLPRSYAGMLDVLASAPLKPCGKRATH